MKIDNNQLSTTPSNWWKTQTNKLTNCLSEFEHFVLLALKEISPWQEKFKKNVRNHYTKGQYYPYQLIADSFTENFQQVVIAIFFHNVLWQLHLHLSLTKTAQNFEKSSKQTLKFSLTVTEKYLHHYQKLFQNR